MYVDKLATTLISINVTGFERTLLPRTQQEDILFTITQQLYTLANISARYQC